MWNGAVHLHIFMYTLMTYIYEYILSLHVFQPAPAPPKNKRAKKSDPIVEDSKKYDSSGVSSDEEPSNYEVMYIYIYNK